MIIVVVFLSCTMYCSVHRSSLIRPRRSRPLRGGGEICVSLMRHLSHNQRRLACFLLFVVCSSCYVFIFFLFVCFSLLVCFFVSAVIETCEDRGCHRIHCSRCSTRNDDSAYSRTENGERTTATTAAATAADSPPRLPRSVAVLRCTPLHLRLSALR